MRYPGGKGKTYQHVINLMPPHRVYIETHLGGGSVLRHKRPAERNIGIDVDDTVIEAWHAQQTVKVELVHGTAEDFLADYQFRGDELVYADPPYLPETRRRGRVYKFDYTADDHERLLAQLRSLPCKVIVSGYSSALYDATLAGWSVCSYPAKTHTDVRQETLWFNYDPPQQLHDCRYFGSDFRKRQSTKRRMHRLQDKIQRMDPVERAAFTQWLNEAYPANPGSTST